MLAMFQAIIAHNRAGGCRKLTAPRGYLTSRALRNDTLSPDCPRGSDRIEPSCRAKGVPKPGNGVGSAENRTVKPICSKDGPVIRIGKNIPAWHHRHGFHLVPGQTGTPGYGHRINVSGRHFYRFVIEAVRLWKTDLLDVFHHFVESEEDDPRFTHEPPREVEPDELSDADSHLHDSAVYR